MRSVPEICAEHQAEIFEMAAGKILICSFPLTTPKTEIAEAMRDHAMLTAAIKNYQDRLVRQEIETFERFGNIIATEKGYFGAFFESDLEKAQ